MVCADFVVVVFVGGMRLDLPKYAVARYELISLKGRDVGWERVCKCTGAVVSACLRQVALSLSCWRS